MASDKGGTGNLTWWSSPMLDGKAYKVLLPDGTDSDLVPRLRDPALLKAFAALADDLRTVVGQIGGRKRKRRVAKLNHAQCDPRHRRARDCFHGPASR